MIVADSQMLVYATLAVLESDLVRQVLERDHAWAAPLLWRSEFRSALLGNVRNARMSLADAARAFADAETLVTGREHSTNTGSVLALSEGNRITAYDLEFVSLANRLAVPLVTFDKEVLAAFPNVAVHPAQFIAAT